MVSKIFVRIGKTFIVLFCLWHMTAVAITAMPGQASGMIVDALRQQMLPILQPYLLWTSQWQNWDLFSPDPMRRITRYRIDARKALEPWHTVALLEPANAPFWRTDEYSYVQQLENGNFGAGDLLTRYVRSTCAPLGLAQDTTVRLTIEYLILPIVSASSDWAQWQWIVRAPWNEWVGAIAPCPDPDDPAVVPMTPL